MSIISDYADKQKAFNVLLLSLVDTTGISTISKDDIDLLNNLTLQITNLTERLNTAKGLKNVRSKS